MFVFENQYNKSFECHKFAAKDMDAIKVLGKFGRLSRRTNNLQYGQEWAFTKLRSPSLIAPSPWGRGIQLPPPLIWKPYVFLP